MRFAGSSPSVPRRVVGPSSVLVPVLRTSTSPSSGPPPLLVLVRGLGWGRQASSSALLRGSYFRSLRDLQQDPLRRTSSSACRPTPSGGSCGRLVTAYGLGRASPWLASPAIELRSMVWLRQTPFGHRPSAGRASPGGYALPCGQLPSAAGLRPVLGNPNRSKEIQL